MKARGGYDLIVIGAGPAGTTTATLVKKHNPHAKVLIVEKASFPRHRVGESLLPGMIPVLKEMGVFEKLSAAGFPRKIGAVFIWGKDRTQWDADFNNLNLEMIRKYGKMLDAEFSFQVLRSRYDQVLLEHAKENGVEVLTRRAVEPIEKNGVICGVVVEGLDGTAERLTCKLLADCSGQQGFLSKVRQTRRYREDLRNVAGYAYFRNAKWKFEYTGLPELTKIFVCSGPHGWFWYIPISKEIVSVGLVAKADYVKRRGVADFKEFYLEAVRACPEIAPMLEKAELCRGIDPAEPEKEFFSVKDWSYLSGQACGPGWLAAGDAAFFIDPLLSSGVMMAHLSGHRAAYTITTDWKSGDPALSRLLWKDYGRFCKEVTASFLALVQYWYHHEPHAKQWWARAGQALKADTPLDLSDRLSFTAVAAGITYHFERAYTSQSLLFGASGVEHSWQWEGTKQELRRWTRQILAIVDTGFMKGRTVKTARARAAQAKVALEEIPDGWTPVWVRRGRRSVAFLPDSGGGLLRPIARLDFPGGDAAANPKRLLPRSYLAILDLVDGRRRVGEIKRVLYRESALARDILDAQVFRILKDLSVLGVVEFRKSRARGAASLAGSASWMRFRAGETALKDGDCPAAERELSAAIAGGLDAAWPRALRGEARRHLGRLAQAREDLDRAMELLALAGPAGGGVEGLIRGFDASIERGWLEDRVRILRGKLRLALGDAAGAREDAEAALKINPRQSEALLVRAKAAMTLKDFETAREDLERAKVIETAGRRNEG